MSNNRGTRARRSAVPSTICMVVIAFHQDPIRMRTFHISRQDDMLVLDGETLRWEYDVPGRTFVLKTAGGGRTIRKYAKVPR